MYDEHTQVARNCNVINDRQALSGIIHARRGTGRLQRMKEKGKRKKHDGRRGQSCSSFILFPFTFYLLPFFLDDHRSALTRGWAFVFEFLPLAADT